ncbi:MAG TPA: glycoside hydrolase family 127 protein, partial [Candidatus Hydrogenedentes bacterium]|nr:glycoside hydrolase family 127 protein [Candidatus Hydrogenedentota bacterium]
IEISNGFAQLARLWRAGDVVELALPMPVRRVLCHDAVEANQGRVAIERGPVVFCAEGIDHGGRILNFAIPDDAPLEAHYRGDLLNGVMTVTGDVLAVHRAEDGGIEQQRQAFTAIPYYAWAHRGVGEMAVWFPRSTENVAPAPPPTIAGKSRPSASHTNASDTVLALNDQIEPKRSGHQEVPRHTWWDHRGTTEWVQYDFDAPRAVSAVEVYWFDDTGAGQCRVPASWKLLYRDGDAWKPVPGDPKYGVRKNRYNRAEFGPVATDAIRIEAQLQDGFSGGVLEWRVE